MSSSKVMRLQVYQCGLMSRIGIQLAFVLTAVHVTLLESSVAAVLVLVVAPIFAFVLRLIDQSFAIVLRPRSFTACLLLAMTLSLWYATTGKTLALIVLRPVLIAAMTIGSTLLPISLASASEASVGSRIAALQDYLALGGLVGGIIYDLGAFGGRVVQSSLMALALGAAAILSLRVSDAKPLQRPKSSVPEPGSALNAHRFLQMVVGSLFGLLIFGLPLMILRSEFAYVGIMFTLVAFSQFVSRRLVATIAANTGSRLLALFAGLGALSLCGTLHARSMFLLTVSTFLASGLGAALDYSQVVIFTRRSAGSVRELNSIMMGKDVGIGIGALLSVILLEHPLLVTGLVLTIGTVGSFVAIRFAELPVGVRLSSDKNITKVR